MRFHDVLIYTAVGCIGAVLFIAWVFGRLRVEHGAGPLSPIQIIEKVLR